MKNPLLILLGVSVAGFAGYHLFKKNETKIKTLGKTPEDKVAYLKSALATAYADGDDLKYTELQRELEFAELEVGL